MFVLVFSSSRIENKKEARKKLLCFNWRTFSFASDSKIRWVAQLKLRNLLPAEGLCKLASTQVWIAANITKVTSNASCAIRMCYATAYLRPFASGRRKVACFERNWLALFKLRPISAKANCGCSNDLQQISACSSSAKSMFSLPRIFGRAKTEVELIKF